jgi:hypothetical protein
MKKTLFILTMAALFLYGCSGITVTSDVDKSVDFSQFKTFEFYGWAKNSDKLLNDIDKRRIETAFGDEFKKRGLTYVEEGGDLVVALYIVTEQKQETTATTTGIGMGYGGYYGYGPRWGWGGGMATTTYNTYDYTVGTLICDVFHKADEKLIWEGTGSGTVDSDPSSRDENIPKAVAKIMSNYPVPPISTKK